MEYLRSTPARTGFLSLMPINNLTSADFQSIWMRVSLSPFRVSYVLILLHQDSYKITTFGLDVLGMDG